MDPRQVRSTPEPPWRAPKDTATDAVVEGPDVEALDDRRQGVPVDVADADIDPVDDFLAVEDDVADVDPSQFELERAGPEVARPFRGLVAAQPPALPGPAGRSGSSAHRDAPARGRRRTGAAPLPCTAGGSNARMPVAVGSSVTRTSIAPVRSADRIACTLVGPEATATTVSIARRSSRPIAMVRDSSPGIGRPDASMKRVLTFATAPAAARRVQSAVLTWPPRRSVAMSSIWPMPTRAS